MLFKDAVNCYENSAASVIRSVIEYRAMVQWYWQGKTEVPGD